MAYVQDGLSALARVQSDLRLRLGLHAESRPDDAGSGALPSPSGKR